MAKGRSGFFDRAEQGGSELDKTGIDKNPVHKSLEDGTKTRYRDAKNVWAEYGLLGFILSHQLLRMLTGCAPRIHSYCAKYGKDPVQDAYDLETHKHFTKGIVWGLSGCKGEDDLPSAKTIRQVWKDFTAQFRRANEPIPRNITLSTTNWVKEQIQRRGLPASKRKRRYATENHLLHLGEQLWGRDWYGYKRPGTRVSMWSQILDWGFTSARVGEYSRDHYPRQFRAWTIPSGGSFAATDITFIVFKNEHGEPEFAAGLTRDAKGMTWTPDKRPEQAIHEGSEPNPFLLNPILTKLAMCLARGAFRDYKTIDDIFNIPAPPDKEVYHIHWDPRICDWPFYESGTTGSEKANSYIHDFRAEGLHLIDSFYSTAQRMGHGGQLNERSHRQYYQPNNPGTDGQDAYLRGKTRTIMADLFRGMKVARNPNLFHCLPAEEKEKLETSQEFVSLKSELDPLKKQPPSQERVWRRGDIYRKLQKIRDKRLRHAQET